VNGWLAVSGSVFALPARRGEEDGSWLWIEAGELGEAFVAELFLPAVAPDRLDMALGVCVGTVRQGDQNRTGQVGLQFGRVRDGRGVLSATGPILDADVRFELRHQPPEGGFCPQCGTALQVATVDVITPPDGGLIGAPVTRCPSCGVS
jgi:hypothetical protein